MADANKSVANDELVSHFMAVTGTMDADKAVSYLEMSGGNLEMAVGLYMEHETGGGGGNGMGHGDDAMMGGGGGGGNSHVHDVRAPDATRTMRLMDDGDDHHHGMMMMMGHGDPALMVMNALMDEQLERSAFANPMMDARAAVNAAAAAAAADIDVDGDDNIIIDDSDDEDAYEDDVHVSSGGVAPPRLSDMFAPPTHLIHKAGGFQGARAIAKDSKRWLLVNIQKDSEFASHALNRDVWRDELVENLITSGFIFWQAVSIANVAPLCIRTAIVLTSY
jgi:UBX domain-containing protein 7